MKRAIVLVLLGLLAGGAILAILVRGRAPKAAPPIAAGALRGANVLLITIDTLRADHVGAYGGAAPTPTLDDLAARGIRFTNAHAHVPATLPAHASILTGLLPPTHGIHINSSAGLDARVPTLAERLHGAGYRTAAFV